ncbi:hypothetical protein [Ornithinimicrobium murale]|uniref:hypothetical protein n=1 Tax=Ornithinimicrobium murale TaxID=1050153 RepID=UPI000E0D6845|nr:hypothetical protein [Ornithinimicrobium murale]
MESTENGYEDEPEYEFVDAADLPRKAPKWVGWGLFGSLLVGAALGAGGVLVSGMTVEDLRGEPQVDASPVTTTICSAAANVRSTGSVSGDIVDTLEFGDHVDGMLSGAWLKLDEGQYVSVSVLCDLAPPEVAEPDTEATTATAGPLPDSEQVTATAQPDPEPTDGRTKGTFVASGTGPRTVELPDDAQTGKLEFEHIGPGPMTITGSDEAATPDLKVDGDAYGTTVFGMDALVNEIEVDTEGEWSLRVAPLDTVPEMVGGIGAPSTAAFYLGEEPGIWRFEPSSAMRITQYGPDGSSASAEIDSSSRVEMQAGGSYVVVYTAGPWTADQVPDTRRGDNSEVTSAP